MIHYDILSINTYDRANWRLRSLVHWMNAIYKNQTTSYQKHVRGNVYMSAIDFGLRPEFAQGLAQLEQGCKQMDDLKELLPLAARACGRKFVAMDDLPHQDNCRYWRVGDVCDCGAEWNPLTDDGDALRLAVKLRIDVHLSTVVIKAFFEPSTYEKENACAEFFGTDPYAATRRAIVRAAAEIGRAMK